MATSSASFYYTSSGTGTASVRRCVPARILTGGKGYYIRYGKAEASLQTPTGTPGVGSAYAIPPTYPYTMGISLVETTAFAGTAVPDTLQVLTTTNTSQISTAAVSSVTSLTVVQTIPATAKIWYAWSFDGRATWWVYLSAAWKQVVKEDGGVWKYLSAPATWTASSIDDVYQALRQAMGVVANQMDGTAVNAMVGTDWQATNGIIPSVTQAVDVAVGLTAGTLLEKPYVASVTMKYADAGTTTIDGWINGDWAALNWTDGTEVADIPWAQTGVISGAQATLDYSVQSGVPGYFLRVKTNGTGPTTTLARILYKAPCQPLANIGDGQPETVNGFLYVDTSKNNIIDYTSQVTDNTLTNLRTALIPMATNDYLYIGFYNPFNAVEFTPGEDTNQASSFLTVEYWTGSKWVALDIEDGTSGETTITMSRKGKVTWTLPSDWKQNIPFDAFLSRAYWIRCSVSAALTSTATIAECRVYSVPTALKKHKYVAVAGDRVFLANRPDGPDQVDVSAPLAEYDWISQNSGAFRVGGQDAIIALSGAYNTLFAWKPSSVHQFTGAGFDAAEAAGRTPMNSQCIVKATTDGKTGLFFLNRNGGFEVQGLHTDSTWNTAMISELSSALDWWDSNVAPRLDLNYLHNACGEYWPKKNWIVWSVPMIFTGTSEQTTNNVIAVLDLNLGCWYPLYVYPFGVSAMCVAYGYNANAPQKLGDSIFLVGDYEGRIIRLFDPAATTDLGSPISWYAQTGPMCFSTPEYIQQLIGVQVFGESTANDLMISLYVDGEGTATDTITFPSLEDPTTEFGKKYSPCSSAVQFNTLSIKWSGTGHGEIHCTELEYANLHDRPGDIG